MRALHMRRNTGRGHKCTAGARVRGGEPCGIDTAVQRIAAPSRRDKLTAMGATVRGAKPDPLKVGKWRASESTRTATHWHLNRERSGKVYD